MEAVVETAAPVIQEQAVEQPKAPVYTVRRDGDPMPAAPAPTVPVVETPAAPSATPAAPVVETPTPVETNPEDVLTSTYGADAKKVLDAWKAGDLENFLKVSATDYRAMDDAEIFKLDIQQKNPGASDKLVNSLLKQQLSKYDSGSFGDEDKEAGEELRKLDADKVRDAFEAAKAGYVIPTPTAAIPDPETQKLQEEKQKEMQQLEAIVIEHPVLKAFEMNPVVQLGEGDDAFTFAVDPSLNKAAITNPEKMLETMFWSMDPATGKKSFDMEAYIDVRNYAANRKKVQAELINHGKTLGSRADYVARVNPDQNNPAPPAGSTAGTVKVRRD